MEIILAIVVVTAVIFFGALISAGNERQRKAIDGLREQVVLWAMQDLRIKRESLAQNVRVEDPLEWFNNIAAKRYRSDINLQMVETYDEPQAIIFSEHDVYKIIFSPLSPLEVKRWNNDKRNRLSRFLPKNPHLFLPKIKTFFEISVLNEGILFDLELAIAWKSLTNQNIHKTNRIWMYILE